MAHIKAICGTCGATPCATACCPMGAWSGTNVVVVVEIDIRGCFGVGSTLEWAFDAGSVYDDRLLITSEPGGSPPAADTLVDTGYVLGFNNASGIAIPTYAERIIITVVPNSNAGTIWSLSVDCDV